MQKKQKSRNITALDEVKNQNKVYRNEESKFSLSILDFKVQSVILILLGFIFYFNTFNNSFAFDDKIVIMQNEYVQAGFAGIPKIFTTETYESFSKQQKTGNPLTGGRYRPLSVATFAIEQQFLGTTEINGAETDIKAIKANQAKQITDMHMRHVVNVILYIILVIVLLYFLRKVIFPQNLISAFVAAVLFIIHPVHTEVVANVKSRDEILSLLFICITFIFSFKYSETRKISDLIFALVGFFLALLSKEYAVMVIILLPGSFYLFRGYSIHKALASTIIYLLPLFVYFLLRFSSISATAEGAEDEIMNNPYLYATKMEALATKFSTMLNYIRLLFLPIRLSADYSYNQIPYTGFSNLNVWVSIIFHLSLIAGMVILMIKRHILAFAIAIYLVFLALVCNLFINIGAPMGERFIFHSSVGFCILIAWVFGKVYIKIKQPVVAKYGLIVLLLMVITLSGFRVIERNKDWNNDATLFLKDVQTVPNSIIANCNAGAACLDNAEETEDTIAKKEWYKRGLPYLDKAITLHKNYMLAYINRGIIFFKLDEVEKSLADCDTVRKYFPHHPSLTYLAYALSDHYFNLGLQAGRSNQPLEAINYFKMALQALPTDADLWYNLGYAYFNTNQIEEAKSAFINALRINPKHPQALNMIGQLRH